MIVVEGDDAQVKEAVAIVEAIKGEPALPGFKGTCRTCRYRCTFAGMEEGDLPEWLKM